MPEPTPLFSDEEAERIRKGMGLAGEPEPSSLQPQRNYRLETESPDDAAYDIRKAKDLGRPREAIAADRERYKAEDYLARVEAMRRETPKSAAWIDQPENYAVARDEVDAIGDLERRYAKKPTLLQNILAFGKSAPRTFGAGLTQLKTAPASIELNARTATDQWLGEVEAWEKRQQERALDPDTYDAKFREAWKKQPWFNVWVDQHDRTNIVPNWNRLIGSGKDERPHPPAQAEFMRPMDSLTLQWGGYERMADYYKRERGISQMIARDLNYRIPELNEEARKQRGERTGNFVVDSALDGVQSAPLTLAAIGAGLVTRSPSVSAGIMGGTVYGMEYGEGVTERGLSHEMASDRAFWHATAELAGERLAFGYFFKQLEADNLMAGFAKSMLVEQGQEQFTTVAQDAIDWNYLHPEKTIAEFIAERPERAAQTAIATLVSSGAIQGGVFGIQALTRGPLHQKEMAENTELQKRLGTFAEAARKLKLLGRSPERAANLVDEIVAGSDMETVVVDLDGLKQALAEGASGLEFDAVVEQLGLTPEQVKDALDTRGEIEVKTSAILTSQAARENAGLLDDHIRHAQDEFTPAKRKTAVAQVEKAVEDALSFGEETVKSGADRLASVQKVRKVLHDRMLQGGAVLKDDMSGEIFRNQHQLLTAMHVTMADLAGMDPLEFTEKHGLLIERERGEAGEIADTGDALDQAWDGKRLSGFNDDVERGTEPFHDDRLGKPGSNRNKMAEMARNGFSNYEIAEEVGVPVPSVEVALSLIRAMGIEIPEAVKIGQTSETGNKANILDMKRRGRTVEQISAATGKRTGIISAMLSQERKRLRDAGEEIPAWLAKEKPGKKVDGLNQSDTTDRGQYKLNTRTVHLFESADPSTLMHEAAHWYLDTLHRLASSPNAPPKIAKMYREILDWYGAGSDFRMFGPNGRITPEGVEFQETFAETFEVYLMRGQAPTPELRSAFQVMKQWIIDVYRRLTGLQRAKLNPDIKAIMDRMLASEDAIEAASRPYVFEAGLQAKALLDKGIITERQYELAKERLHDKREEAKEELLALLIGEYVDRRKAEVKAAERRMTVEETKAFDESQAGRAWNWLARGAWKGKTGEKIETPPPFEDADVLAQANKAGYEGSDRGEARQWLEAVAKGLDMSAEARMQRARDMGFDTETVLYHGTKEDIQAFVGAVHLGTSDQAQMRSLGSGSTIMPLYVKDGLKLSRSKDTGGDWAAKIKSAKSSGADGIVYINRYEGITSDVIQRLDEQGLLSKLDGMTDAQFKRAVPEAEESFIIFNPSNIRSVHAAFDPDNSASADLLAQSGEWSASGYARVMPRDLFNEAKTLSMYMKLVADYNDGLLPDGFVIEVEDEVADVSLSESGELYLNGVNVYFNGSPATIAVTYNAGKDSKFPLSVTVEDMDAWYIPVYKEDGSLDQDFTETFGSETAAPKRVVSLSGAWGGAQKFLVQLGVVGLWHVDGMLPRNFVFDLKDDRSGFDVYDDDGRTKSQNVLASINGVDVEFYVDARSGELMFESDDESGQVISNRREIHSDFKAFLDAKSSDEDSLSQSMPAETWVDMSRQLRDVADAGLALDPQNWITLIEQMRDAAASGVHTTAETWIARAQAMRDATAATAQASAEVVSDRAMQARDMMQAGMDKALEAYARLMAELSTAPHRAHELWNTIRESMDRILYDTLMAVKEFAEVHTNYLRAAIADTVGPLRLRAEAEAAARAEGMTLNEKALRDAMDQLGSAVSAVQTFLKYEVELLRRAFNDAADKMAALWGQMAGAMNLETLRERGLELAAEVRQGAEQIADVIATHLVETSVAASAAVAASQREIRSAVRGTVLDRMFRKRTPMQTISSDLFDMAPDNASPEFVRRYLDEQAQTTAVALREIAACAAGAVAAPIVTIAAGVTLGSIPGIALGAHILTKDARSEREAEAALKAFRESTSYIEAEKRIKKNMERAALDEQRRQAAKLFFDTFSVESLSADDGFLRNSQVEQYTGIDAGFLDDLISHESGGQYDAKNPDSTATGGGQFIDSTWMNMMRQYGEGAGLDMEVNTANRDAILELRNDPRWATLMTAIYARENAEYMTGRVQRDLTAKDGYLAHFLGVDGAIKAINADASASVEDVMSDSVLKANKNVFYKRDGSPRTMGEFLKYQTRNFTADPLVVNEGWVPMTNLDDGREDRP